MSDFLIHAARLQDAGINSLEITLDVAPDGERLMHVFPSESTAEELAARFPMRTFSLCGTDRLLESLKDDMIFGEGPMPEKVAKAIANHPELRDDLLEWAADWELVQVPIQAELDAVELDESEVQRSVDRMMAVMHGIEIARNREMLTKQKESK